MRIESRDDWLEAPPVRLDPRVPWRFARNVFEGPLRVDGRGAEAELSWPWKRTAVDLHWVGSRCMYEGKRAGGLACTHNMVGLMMAMVRCKGPPLRGRPPRMRAPKLRFGRLETVVWGPHEYADCRFGHIEPAGLPGSIAREQAFSRRSFLSMI